jgi:hypothetical protein
MNLKNILAEVQAEASRSIVKHGDQSHVPMGTGANVHPLDFGVRGVTLAPAVAELAKAATDERTKEGTVTWRDILTEEVLEAYAEDDPNKLRAELIQVAAVAVKMVAALESSAPVKQCDGSCDSMWCSTRTARAARKAAERA